MSNNNEVTPDQYMMRTMRQNVAAKFAEYEEKIALLQTQLAMKEQELNNLKNQESQAPAPPAPQIPEEIKE